MWPSEEMREEWTTRIECPIVKTIDALTMSQIWSFIIVFELKVCWQMRFYAREIVLFSQKDLREDLGIPNWHTPYLFIDFKLQRVPRNKSNWSFRRGDYLFCGFFNILLQHNKSSKILIYMFILLSIERGPQVCRFLVCRGRWVGDWH